MKYHKYLFLYMKAINNYINMKHINTYITEKLKISKGLKYTLFPKTKEELLDIVQKEIEKNGNECSLKHIDTSKLTDISDIFYKSDFN